MIRLKVKRTLVSVLAVMTLALAVMPASFAASKGYSITVTDTNENHVYTAYQIFAGTLDSAQTTLSDITWGTGVDSAGLLAALAADTSDVLAGAFTGVTAETTASELSHMVEALNNDQLRAFAGIAGNNLSGTGKSGNYDSTNQYYKITGLKSGYHIVVDSLSDGAEEEMHSSYIVQVVKDVVVSPKTSVPTITKTVFDKDSDSWGNGTDSGIGDLVKFQVSITLPDNFNDYDTYTCIVNDKMSDGLTFTGVDTVKIDGTSILRQYHSFTTDAENVTHITIDVKGARAHDGSVVDVFYTAKINSSAVAGDPETNSATLTYSNNPTGKTDGTLTSDTPEDTAHVYTYKLDLTKKSAGDGTVLPGAVFTLSKGAGEDARYAVIADGKLQGWSPEAQSATGLVSDENGAIIIDGLDDGTYTLTEKKAPDGYDSLPDPITVIIDGTQDSHGIIERLTCSANGNGVVPDSVSADMSTGTAAFHVENAKGSLLPLTGGKGVKTIFFGGSLIMAAGCAGMLLRRRRTVEDR